MKWYHFMLQERAGIPIDKTTQHAHFIWAKRKGESIEPFTSEKDFQPHP